MTEQNPKIDGHDRGPDAARHDGGHGRARTGPPSASAEERREREQRKTERAAKRKGAK